MMVFFQTRLGRILIWQRFYETGGSGFNLWLVKTILSCFFQTLLPHVLKTYFSTNPSFRLVETYFQSSGNSMLLFGDFFLQLEIMIKIRGNLNRKIFSCQWKPFSIFLPEEAVFPHSGNVFFNECFILDSGNRFSGKCKP